jgi:hypothetical protein
VYKRFKDSDRSNIPDESIRLLALESCTMVEIELTGEGSVSSWATALSLNKIRITRIVA